MTEPNERDRAIAKAMTFREVELHSGPVLEVERMAEYLAAYRAEIERAERAERERVLVELLFLPGGWRMEAGSVGAMNGPRHRSDALRMCAQDIEAFVEEIRSRA